MNEFQCYILSGAWMKAKFAHVIKRIITSFPGLVITNLKGSLLLQLYGTYRLLQAKPFRERRSFLSLSVIWIITSRIGLRLNISMEVQMKNMFRKMVLLS